MEKLLCMISGYPPNMVTKLSLHFTVKTGLDYVMHKNAKYCTMREKVSSLHLFTIMIKAIMLQGKEM